MSELRKSAINSALCSLQDGPRPVLRRHPEAIRAASGHLEGVVPALPAQRTVPVSSEEAVR
ncbi:hypothetical protein SRO_0859 [Streptomyces rochei]|nr:hypothetical protein SRO_0859 [Streptomyces rochei]